MGSQETLDVWLDESPLRVPQTRQLFIRTHNEPLSVIAVRIGNEDCSSARIHGCDTKEFPIARGPDVAIDRKTVRKIVVVPKKLVNVVGN
jgi:hypothetical protein